MLVKAKLRDLSRDQAKRPTLGAVSDEGVVEVLFNPTEYGIDRGASYTELQVPGLATPILFVMIAIAVAKSLRWRLGPEKWLLAVVTTVFFAFFVYSALKKRVEANWPAPAYVGGVVLFACYKWSDVSKRWRAVGIAARIARSRNCSLRFMPASSGSYGNRTPPRRRCSR